MKPESFLSLTQEEYLDLLTSCIAALSPDICLHRVTGDGPRKLLIAPQWSLFETKRLKRATCPYETTKSQTRG